MRKVIILDDEELSVAKLAKSLQESGMVEIVGKFTQPLEALAFLKTYPVQAAFLDIEMPDLDGIEFANRLMDLQEGVAVVFVTAYNQYAVEAFRLNALDYLLKPVTAERLQETLKRLSAAQTAAPYSRAVQVCCFGKFDVNIGNAAVKFRTEKARELLAFLIDRQGDFVHRGEICDCLWEDYDGDRALIHFHTTLYYMKKALLQQGAAIPIEHQRGSYRLNGAELDCDAWRFQAFAAKTGSVSRNNVAACEEIIGLYRGNYLVDTPFNWAERQRQMVKDQLIRLLLNLTDYYKTAGDAAKIVTWMKQGLIHEPLHRELNYRLLEALVAVNDLIAAGRYYDIYRSELARKLGRKPDDSFRELLG